MRSHDVAGIQAQSAEAGSCDVQDLICSANELFFLPAGAGSPLPASENQYVHWDGASQRLRLYLHAAAAASLILHPL